MTTGSNQSKEPLYTQFARHGRRWVSLSLFMMIMMCAVVVTVGVSAPVFADGMGNETQPQDPNDPNPDEPCNTPDCEPDDTDCTDPVSPYNGREFLRRTDLTVNGLFPIVIERRYNSAAAYDSTLGYGWALNHDKRLYEYSDGSVILRFRCGRRDRFVYSGGTYVRPGGGMYGSLDADVATGGYVFTYTNGYRDVYDAEGRLIQQIHPRGHQLEYSYSGIRYPITGSSPYSVDPTVPMTTAYSYRLLKIEERAANNSLTGHFVQFNYDNTTGRMTSAVASDGRTVTYEHDQTSDGKTLGNLTKVIGLENIVTTYRYEDPNDNHNLTYVQQGAGATPFVNVYDEQDRVSSQTLGNRVVTFNYVIDYTETRVARTVTDEQGQLLYTANKTYFYDGRGYLTKVIDTLGNEVQYSYNNSGFLGRREIWEKQGASLVLLQAADYQYDSLGHRTQHRVTLDTNEVITRNWTYDQNEIASVQVVSSLNPGKIFRTQYTFYYDANGIPTGIKDIMRRRDDGSFQTTTLTYDALGRVDSITLPDNQKIIGQYTGWYLNKIYYEVGGAESPYLNTRFDYDAHGNRNKIWDGQNNLTQFEYDDRGRPTRIVNALNEEILLGYTNNNLTQVEVGRTAADGPGQITKLIYNNENWLKEIQRQNDANAFIPFLKYQYNSDGQRIGVTDANQKTWQLNRDDLGRLTSVADPLSKTTRYGYDATGNRTSVIDANNQQTDYFYDDLDRLIRIEEPGNAAGQGTRMVYDAAGNVAAVTDAENQTTSYLVDALSRRTRVTQPLNQAVNNFYDNRNRLDYVINARGNKIDYNYEPWGPLKTLQVFATASSGTPLQTVGFGYDYSGNRTSVSDDTILGTNPLYATVFDALNRPDVTTINYLPGGPRTLDNNYDRYQNRDTLTFTGGGSTKVHSYQFNKLNQLISASLPGNQAFSFDYFDTNQLQTLNFPNGLVSNLTYFDNLPLQTKDLVGSAGNLLPLTFTYDNVLNIDTITDSHGLHDYNYDNLNRLTQALHPAPSGLTNESYTYDQVGNRENPADLTQYNYDNNNRITKSPTITSYGYDLDGNLTSRSDGAVLEYNAHNQLTRFTKGATDADYLYDPLGKRLKKDVNGTVTWYLWDQYMLLAEYNGSGTQIKRYAYLPGNYLPAQMEDANGTYTVHSDHLQTPRLMTDSTQTVVWRSTHQAFGASSPDEDADTNGTPIVFNMRFAGQYYDEETGLHYNRYRYYDASIGRYITSDPIGLMGGINTYVYGENNPLYWMDPYGLVEAGLLGSLNIPVEIYISSQLKAQFPDMRADIRKLTAKKIRQEMNRPEYDKLKEARKQYKKDIITEQDYLDQAEKTIEDIIDRYKDSPWDDIKDRFKNKKEFDDLLEEYEKRKKEKDNLGSC